MLIKPGKLVSRLHTNTCGALPSQTLNKLGTNSKRIYKDQPGSWRHLLLHRRQQYPFPGGMVEPISYVSLFTFRTMRRLLFNQPGSRWLNPIALALEGIGRQGYAPPLFMSIESAPITRYSGQPELT